MESTSKQRQDIGFLRKLLGMPDDVYREMLWSRFKVESSKQLREEQARKLLKILRDQGKATGVFKPTKQYAFQKYKYNNLYDREDMAEPKQLRMIEGLWFEVSRQNTDEKRAEALRKLLKRIVKVDDLKFLQKKDVSKVVKVLQSMKRQKEENSL